MQPPLFKLKGSTLTTVVLELQQYSSRSFASDLAAKIAQAPQLFQDAPLLIQCLETVPTDTELTALLQSCRDAGLKPLAIQLSDASESQFNALPVFDKEQLSGKSRQLKTDVPEVVVKTVTETVTETVAVHKPAMIVERPVRSGQQVYAKGCDLVVLSQVGEGAVVVADGSIHVYGYLRGRAIAGAEGNTQARIYCQKLQAELMSIAGAFVTKDSIDESLLNRAAQVYLVNDEPVIDAL